MRRTAKLILFRIYEERSNMKKLIYLLISAAMLTFHVGSVSAVETGWSPVIIATGSYRQKIRSTPIEHRPNRPLHFYGNSVRRNHHRSATPSFSPMRQALPRFRFLRN